MRQQMGGENDGQYSRSFLDDVMNGTAMGRPLVRRARDLTSTVISCITGTAHEFGRTFSAHVHLTARQRRELRRVGEDPNRRF